MAEISNKPGYDIKHIRLRRKMSQGDVCHEIGMDRSYMSAIENRKVNVTLAVLEKLTNILHVSKDKLLQYL